jgi:hypothetical protein
MGVRRTLVKYDKVTGKMVAEYELHGIELEELRMLFGETVDDPMFHSYDVTEIQKPRLEKAASVSIDLDNFDYCVEATAVAPTVE